MDYSIQLYSARNFPPVTDLLPRLAALGYTRVEGFGGLYADAKSLAGALAASGLTMPTGHFGLDMLQDTDATLRTAETLGIRTLFCPAVPRELWDQPEDGWRRLADTLAGLGAAYRSHGLGFGWHNHHFEFVPTAGGALPIEIILDGAPDIEWELDVAWVVRSGNDPFAWIDRYPDRITAVHIKDIAPEGEAADEDGWADVGHGTMAWGDLMAAISGNTSCAHYVMEHDNPSDIDRFARRSVETLKRLGY